MPQNTKGVELNTVINIVLVFFIIMLISIGLLLFNQKTSVQDIYRGVFKQNLPSTQQKVFKTIEVIMYDKAPQNISSITTGLKKFDNGELILEILNVTNTTSKVISKKIETSQIKETKHVDVTIILKVLAEKKYGRFYANNAPINTGDEFKTVIEHAFVNGTITKII